MQYWPANIMKVGQTGGLMSHGTGTLLTVDPTGILWVSKCFYKSQFFQHCGKCFRMLYGWLYEEGFIKDILNSYHHHILPKRKYFLMKKGQLPSCNIVEKTVSNVWEWFTDKCNNYIKWFWLITRQFYMTSKLIFEGLLYELVSNTTFLVCQKYRYYLQVSWSTCAILMPLHPFSGIFQSD